MLLTGINLLIVEDDLDSLEIMSLCMASEGATVLVAQSIESALSRASARAVDLLLCDLLLPDGEACTLLRQLRERPGCRSVPGIVVTGFSDRNSRLRAQSCGFAGYAVKPVKLDELVSSIARLARKAPGLA